VSSRPGRVAVTVLLLAMTLGGCVNDPDPADSKKSLQSSRATVMAEIQKVGNQLEGDGATLAEASGRFTVCSSAPTTSLEYGGGGKLAGDPRPIEARVKAAATTLESAGWKVTYESYAEHAAANLEKDGLHLSLRPDPLRGGDALTFGIVGECIRVTNEQVGEHGQTDTIVPKTEG
jgi:hypothetical protein